MVTTNRAKPKSSEELFDHLYEHPEVAEDRDEFKSLIDDYVNEVAPQVEPQRQEQLREEFQKFLEDNGITAEDVRKRLPMSPDTSKGDPDAPGAEMNGQFRRLGEFFKIASHRYQARNGRDPRLKSLATDDESGSGLLVPEEFRADLMQMAIEGSIIRPRATTIPMTRGELTMPVIHDASHASTVFGGVSASWIAEEGDISTVTQPTFGDVRLRARKLTGYTVASNELLADSAVAMEALIRRIFPQAIAYFEDDAMFSGTGAGQPLGILNADALVTVSAETGQSANTIVWENIVNMYSRMMPQSLGNAVWIANIDTFPQLATMSLAVGTGGSAIWINNGVEGPPATILGRPVIFTEKAETLGTAGDIYFVDLSNYLIGDRQALEVASSEHVNFDTDRMTWRFIERVDGRPWITTALTPRNGSNTLSPFVNLATRS